MADKVTLAGLTVNGYLSGELESSFEDDRKTDG